MSQVREVDPLASDDWDRFVRSLPNATVDHLAAWSLETPHGAGATDTAGHIGEPVLFFHHSRTRRDGRNEESGGKSDRG